MRGLRTLLGLVSNPVTTLRGLRLRTQYALVLLVILLVLGAVVVGTAEFFQQQTIEQEQEDLDRTAELAAEQIDESITGSHARLRGKSSEFEANLTNHEDILQSTADETEFFGALVTDENGVVQDIRGDFDAEAREFIGSDLSGEPYIAEALAGNAYIQDPTEEADGNITLTMTAPIHVNSTLQGVIAGAILLGPDGGIHGGRGADFFRALQPLDTSVQSAFVEQEGNSTLRVHTAGEPFDDAVTSAATVESTGWTVRLERDRSAFTDQLELLQFVQFGSLFVVLVSVAGLGFYQYRSNLRQTEQLLDGFDRLGSGQFDHRLAFAGAREWEQISDGFNQLATGLSEREETIREREEEIREREQRLSVLNRVLRHNLRNDVNVIITKANLVAAVASSDRQEEAAESIVDTAEELVAHSEKARRLETVMENAEGSPVRLDIADVVERLLAEYRREFSATTVEANSPEQAPVSAVQGLEFGIECLIENAFEHTDSDDPVVRVTVTVDDEYVRVTVEDNGSGIPEHEQAVLDHREETSLEHGSGIGLWLAYWAVVKSGGTLSFGDQSAGGSVTASLPRTDEE
jgi:signal transduction histidine kinase